MKRVIIELKMSNAAQARLHCDNAGSGTYDGKKHRLRTSRIISTCTVLLVLILYLKYLTAGCKKNQFRRF